MIEFTPRTWKNGEAGDTAVAAAALNRMEDGIEAAVAGVNAATDVLESGRLSEAGLSATIDGVSDLRYDRKPQVRTNRVWSGRKTLTVDGRDFYIKGVNLGLNGGSFYDAWVSKWSEALYLSAIDRVARAGFNTLRIIGMYRAYADDPVLYKARLHSLFEKAREVGLKVVYEFLTNAGVPSDIFDWDQHQADYKAMFLDLTEGYRGDPMILAWGVGNEMHAASDDPGVPVSAFMKIISNFAPWIKTQDPGTFVTASQAISGDYEEAFAKIAATDPYVDLHALHVYLTPSTLHYGRGSLQAWCDATPKPIYINEIGANRSTEAGGPHVGGMHAQASFMRMFKRQLHDSDINGVMFWKAFDNPDSGAVMGLWNFDGTPTPQLDAVMTYPDHRMPGVREYVESRPHPVLLDNFDRPAAVGTVGAPDVGATPTVITGTWGIRADGGAYVSTKAGSTSDKMVWDCKTRQTPCYEAEMVAVTDLASFGIIWDWTDASNYMTMRLQRLANFPTHNQVIISKVVGGVATDLLTETMPGLAAADHSRRVRLNIRLVKSGAKRWVYPSVYGIPLPRVDITTGPTPTSKRGVMITAVDSASYVAAVRSYIEGRVAP